MQVRHAGRHAQVRRAAAGACAAMVKQHDSNSVRHSERCHVSSGRQYGEEGSCRVGRCRGDLECRGGLECRSRALLRNTARASAAQSRQKECSRVESGVEAGRGGVVPSQCFAVGLDSKRGDLGRAGVGRDGLGCYGTYRLLGLSSPLPFETFCIGRRERSHPWPPVDVCFHYTAVSPAGLDTVRAAGEGRVVRDEESSESLMAEPPPGRAVVISQYGTPRAGGIKST